MDKPNKFSGDISKKIFADFLLELQKRGINSEIAKRLSENYKSGQLTEPDLKNSLLFEDAKQ